MNPLGIYNIAEHKLFNETLCILPEAYLIDAGVALTTFIGKTFLHSHIIWAIHCTRLILVT